MRIILVRHGETIENKKGIIQGHLPGHLSEKGKKQAKQLALRLKDENIDFIYSSDLARARHTAEKIQECHSEIPFELNEALREMDKGEHTGNTLEERGLTSIFNMYTLKTKRGESVEQLLERANHFVDGLLETHKHDCVLLVAHDTINRAIITILMKKGVSYFEELGGSPNASLSIFEIDDNGNTKTVVRACTKHLH
ncbi:histidine phosphatase family protein [archaeon]|nr:histidine phosphatase family protein [archaeon]